MMQNPWVKDTNDATAEWSCYCKICGNEFDYNDLEGPEQNVDEEIYEGVCRLCEVDQ
jgi:hypothetical protein